MASSLSRITMRVPRLVYCTVHSAEPLLDPAVLRHFPSVVPFRTKKRYFIPPAVKDKGRRGKGPEGMETKAKNAGVVVRQEYMERMVNISCTAGVFDPYIPPEGDGRLSGLSKESLKQRTEQLKQSATTMLAIRKIKEHDPDFSTKEFPARAQDIFIQSHDALTNFDKVKLHSLVTERCYPEMVRGNRYKTIRWTFVESLEPPRLMHARCPDMVSKGNLYGQVTVRMHSRQTLAIYDRFGRLMMGDEEVPRDVLEYLVLERHLVNPYSRWRLHGKIVPSWAPPKDPVVKTVLIPGPQLEPWQEYQDLNPEVVTPKAVQWHK